MAEERTVLEPFVEFADFFFELGGERSGLDPAADFGAGLGKLVDVVDVQTFQTRGDAVLQTPFLQKQAKRLSRGGKTVRHADARIGQLTEQFAQRSILAAHTIHVGHAKLAERKYITALNHLILLLAPRKSLRAGCC